MITSSLLKAHLILLTSFILLISGYNAAIDPLIRLPRMIGGLLAEDEYPFIVSILIRKADDYDHLCGGAIINERTVITAAHCLYYHRPSSLKIHVGEKPRKVIDGKVYDIEALHCHDKYNGIGHDFDVGLVRIQGSFEFNDNVQLIVLAETQDIIIDGSYATILGWGVTNVDTLEEAEYLMEAHVPIVKQKICNRFMGGQITPRMLCAGFQKGGVDACQMDSGGPLLYNNKLTGIISWGLGCAKPNKPGVYTRISNVLPWIKYVLHEKYYETLEKPSDFVEMEIKHLVEVDTEID